MRLTISHYTWRIFRLPLLINGICIIGLASAFAGNGWWDILSWSCFFIFASFIFYSLIFSDIRKLQK